MVPRSFVRLDLEGIVPRSPGLSWHDLVLAAIPTVFLAAVLVGHVATVPGRDAIAGASVVTAVVVADALFLNPPRGPATGRAVP